MSQEEFDPFGCLIGVALLGLFGGACMAAAILGIGGGWVMVRWAWNLTFGG